MGKQRRRVGRGALAALAGLQFLLAAPASANGYRAGGGAERPLARPIDRWGGHIREASARFGVPEDWIRRVMRAESGGRTTFHGRPITSPAGAMGLMQLMPATWAEMRAAHRLGPDPHDPRDNILAGTAYLRALYERFGYPGLFAAYNAGPSRYAEHLAGARRLPAETVAYVAAVGADPTGAVTAQRRSAAQLVSPRTSDIFVALAGVSGDSSGVTTQAAATSLFVSLNSLSTASQ